MVTNLTEFGDNVIQQKFTNEVLLSTLSFSIWPSDPDIHVVETPVQVEPDQPGFQHGFVNLIYITTADGAQVDGATKVFTSPSPGYSVPPVSPDGRTGAQSPVAVPRVQGRALGVVE